MFTVAVASEIVGSMKRIAKETSKRKRGFAPKVIPRAIRDCDYEFLVRS